MHEPELAVGDRIAVRVVRREPELLVDLRLELFGERVLEKLCLGVDGVERQSEAVDEVALEQAVMPHDLQRAASAGVGRARRRGGAARSTRPSSSRRLVIAVADGALTPMRVARADVVTRSPEDSRT